MTPRILVIAGSDSGGGAGIQADIKTVTMLGGHAMTAITAITAQNTRGVQSMMPVPTAMVVAQIEACLSDIGADAVKIGMIGSAETAHAVADRLAALDVPIVFDPVMVATSGAMLADPATIAAFARLMRIATLTTPNLPELAVLLAAAPGGSAGGGSAGGGAEALARTFGTTLLAKGGHGEGPDVIDRLVGPEGEIARWSAPRIDTTSAHGTGCTLASAIATLLAQGRGLSAAVAGARTFVRLALRGAPGLGGGHGPMGQQSVRLDLGADGRLNQITLGSTDPAASRDFYRALGLRQIVERADHYARFETPGGATLSIEQGARPTVFLECDDLDATVARLEADGMVFDQPPTDRPWLWREARLRDPAGNTVCLYHAGENRRFPPWRLPDA
ncbi:bifunctional hydroxymethylpyrimidine kinase/phosphomethylpyrimidine kinase [Sphingomonas sp. TREG-RG-20F-R18-01]|uniref:bifunctional hydroxymethylpyrimidine kinase/phosphomethylpyrimidine kinase n=1 Tax=Sphingomonas sp. TREG-RG-20F-R18-01 TaxID=2914982 RepID=UPI001F5613FC|nr:bifunctional hydroxymethylpyrimidine kinase/phosphomethylpyrimidine kinase [Sphingomonas sp. TREG-RG-20F-R18-01]